MTINNGILLNGIKLRRKILVTASSVRFRLWGNTRKIIISDLKIVLPELLGQDSKPHKNPRCSKKPNHEKSLHQGISIFSQNAFVKGLVKLVLRLFPTFDLDVRSCEVYKGNVLANTAAIQLIGGVKDNSDPEKLQLFLSITVLDFSVTFKPSEKAILSSGSLRFLTSYSLCMETGVISRGICHLSFVESHLSVFDAINVLLAHEKPEPPTLRNKSTEQQLGAQLLSVSSRFLGTFEEFSITASNLQLAQLPILPASKTFTLEDYFAQQQPKTSFKVSVKSLAIHLTRIDNRNAGFEVLFNCNDDLPFELTLSSLVLAFSFVTINEDSFVSETSEFLTIPNFGCTLKTNIPGHIFRGRGLLRSTLELFCSCSSPILDFDVEQLALVSFNYLAIKKLLQLHKLAKQRNEEPQASAESSDISASENDDTNHIQFDDGSIGSAYKDSSTKPNSFSKLLDKAYYLLEDSYPHVDVKLTIEQPRTLLSCYSGVDEKLQYLMLSFSMMILQVLTVSYQEYNAKCHVLHPCVTFNQKTHTTFEDEDTSQEFCGLSEIKLCCKVMKSLKFQPAFEMHGAYLNLTKPKVLRGFGHLVNETAKIFSLYSESGQINKQLDVALIRERDDLRRCKAVEKKPPMLLESLFSLLPTWFVCATFKLVDADVWLGLTSPFMKSEQLDEFLFSDTAKLCDVQKKIHFHISSIFAQLDGSNNDVSGSDSSVSSHSLETLAADKDTHVFWRVVLATKGLGLSVSDEFYSKSTSVLEIPSFDAVMTATMQESKPVVLLESTVDEINVLFDRYKAYTIFGLVHLIKHSIVKPLQRLSTKFKRSSRSLGGLGFILGTLQLLDFISCYFSLRRLNAVVGLYENFQTRIQMFDANLAQNDRSLSAHVLFCRVLISSPIQQGLWDRILCIDSLSCRVNDPGDNDFYVVEAPAIRIMQPHNFVVYELFDSLSIFVKVLKHSVAAVNEKNQGVVVYSSESPPIIIPAVKVKTQKLSFAMEDDPFESELSMIYQLGLVEQKKRLDLLSLYEQSLIDTDDQDDLSSHLDELYRIISVLWIRKVLAYKTRLVQEIESNSEFLFGSETEIPKEDNVRVRPYQKYPPLLHIILSGVDLNLTSPRFSPKDLPQFIYDCGQGVPKSTTYNMLLPMYLKLAVEELRMHLRDYPLPLLFLPRTVDLTGKGRALLMQGNMVVAEAMCTEEHSFRRLRVSMTDLRPTHRRKTDQPNEPSDLETLIVMKSLAPVKVFTDMDILFDAEQPSRFVWGQSYQFGIQQIMLKFDQFSKPSIDPLPALGFWDKMRLIMHGHLVIKTGKRASLEVAFKGGRDPYNMFVDSTGFVLRFKDSVVWKVNENDDSLQFFDVFAQKVSWYIPNYLATPLICWCRESSKYSFLSPCKEIITSCFAYYLFPNDNLEDGHIRHDVSEKKVVVLSGGVNFKVGFLLQRHNSKGEIVRDCKAHHMVNLCDPERAEPNHDSYVGFRSTRIHMALSLVAHTVDSYNTIHLSPRTLEHFFSWWHLFAGNMMLPVRRGMLFGQAENKTKFSENLYTNKFLFHLKNLFLSHVHKVDEFDTVATMNEFECVGLRAKIDDFLVDLHQRKEQVIDVNEDLSRKNKVMKMLFNLGEVVLAKIDLRTLHALFNREVYSSGKRGPEHISEHSTHKLFDNDKRWYDYRDYLEAFVPSERTVLRTVEIEPLMFSEKFLYIRNASDSDHEYSWGNENTHDCMLHATDVYATQVDAYTERIEELKRIYAKNNGGNAKRSARRNSNEKDGEGAARLKESIDSLKKLITECAAQQRKSCRDSVTSLDNTKEKFHNRFVIISMFLKWNEDVRNQFMKYLHFVELRGRFKKYMSYTFISMLENVMDGENITELFSFDSAEEPKRIGSIGKFSSSNDRLDNYDKIIRQVRDKERILEDCQIEILLPQIQLHTKDVDDSVVLITAPVLEAKIFSVVMDRDSNTDAKTLETRYGCLLHDASVLVFDKSTSSDFLNFEEKPYGTTSSWPPFLGIETCKTLKETLKEQTLIDQMSLMLTYTELCALGKNLDLIELGTEEKEDSTPPTGNRLCIDVPELVIRSTSKQYFTLYVTVLSLLMYMEPLTADLREKVLKLKFSIDFEDYDALHDRLKGLHEYLALTRALLNNYTFRHDGYLDNASLNDYFHLMDTKAALSAELLLTVQTLFTGDVFSSTSLKDVETWRVAADKMTLHMLEDDRRPILDLVIEQGRYKRMIKDDGLHDNCFEIANIRGETLLPEAYFHTFLLLLTPTKDNLITVNWSMNRPVSGIKVMDNFEIASLPLNMRVDEQTGRLLMKFIFYNEAGELDESPILRMSDQADFENMGRYASDDEASSKISGDDLQRSTSGASRKHRKVVASVGLPLKSEYDQEVDQMLERSRKYISIKRMVLRAFELSISLHMKSGVKKWLNVTDFLLALPEWEIEREILSLLDVANMFKKLVIKTLVHHSGRLLTNKLSTMLANRRRLSDLLLRGEPKFNQSLEVYRNSEPIIEEIGDSGEVPKRGRRRRRAHEEYFEHDEQPVCSQL